MQVANRTIRWLSFGFFEGVSDVVSFLIVTGLLLFALYAIFVPPVAFPDDAVPPAPPSAVTSPAAAAPDPSPSSGAAALPKMADTECMNCSGTVARFELGVMSEFVAGEWKAGPEAWLYYEAGVGFGDQAGITLGRMFAEGSLGLRNGDVIGETSGDAATVTPASIRVAAGYKFIFSRRTYKAPTPSLDDKDPDLRDRTVLISAYGRIGGEFSPTSEDINPSFAKQGDAGLCVEAFRGEEQTFKVTAGAGWDQTLNPPGSIPTLADGTLAKTLVGVVEGEVPIVRRDKLSGKIRARLSQQLMNQDVLQRGARVTIAIAAGWN